MGLDHSARSCRNQSALPYCTAMRTSYAMQNAWAGASANMDAAEPDAAAAPAADHATDCSGIDGMSASQASVEASWAASDPRRLQHGLGEKVGVVAADPAVAGLHANARLGMHSARSACAVLETCDVACYVYHQVVLHGAI